MRNVPRRSWTLVTVIGYELVVASVLALYLAGVYAVVPILELLTAPVGVLAMFTFLAFPVLGTSDNSYLMACAVIFLIGAIGNGWAILHFGRINKRRRVRNASTFLGMDPGVS